MDARSFDDEIAQVPSRDGANHFAPNNVNRHAPFISRVIKKDSIDCLILIDESPLGTNYERA